MDQPTFPQEEERRHRRVSRTQPHDLCPVCGGALTIKVLGRERRLVCRNCDKPPDRCGCRAPDSGKKQRRK